MTNVTLKTPWIPKDPFTTKTYALVDAYTKATGGRTMEEAWVGDASIVIFASDVLLERGTPSWDACGADVVRAMCAPGGFDMRAGTMARAVLAFRRWLVQEGHASDAGIDELERFAAEAKDESPPLQPNRAERRWQARLHRRAGRR